MLGKLLRLGKGSKETKVSVSLSVDDCRILRSVDVGGSPLDVIIKKHNRLYPSNISAKGEVSKKSINIHRITLLVEQGCLVEVKNETTKASIFYLTHKGRELITKKAKVSM